MLDNQSGELAGLDGGGADAADAGSASLDVFVPVDAAPPPPAVDSAAPAPVVDAGAPPPPVDSGTLPTCAFGQKLCDGTCVAIDNPLFGCGATTCDPCALDHAAATCAGSGCAVSSCNPGYADCDQTADDGCETDLSEPTHCGTCNAQCAAGSPYCTPTTTSAGTFMCASGCSAVAPTLCGSQCVDLQSALDNCGACGNACPEATNGQATCAAGVCSFVCEADFHACGTSCATDLSPATCGASCAPCPTGANAIPSCDGAQCGIKCEPHFANCNGVASDGCEVSLLTDPSNCGACNDACDSGQCTAGACVIVTPPPPVDAGAPPVDAGSPQDTGAPDVTSPPPPPPPPPVDAAAATPDAEASDVTGD